MSLSEIKGPISEQQRLEFTESLSLQEFFQKHFGYWWHEVLQNSGPLYLVNPAYFGQSSEQLSHQKFHTVCSTAVFARAQRVADGEPILSPTSYLEQKGHSPLILTAYLYQFLQTVKYSYPHLAVWGGTEITLPFWQRIPQITATPANIESFAKALSDYHLAFTEFKQTGQVSPGLKEMAEEIGLLGFWRNMFGGQLDFQQMTMFFDELKEENLTDARQKFTDGKSFLQTIFQTKSHHARDKLSPPELQLVDLALPVAFVFRKKSPLFYINNSVGINILQETFNKPFPMRPVFNTACSPSGLYPEQVKQVLIDAQIEDSYLEQINQILYSWGCPSAEKIASPQGLDDCKLSYKQEPFHVSDFLQAIEQGGLIRVIDDHSLSAQDDECLYDRSELRNKLKIL